DRSNRRRSGALARIGWLISRLISGADFGRLIARLISHHLERSGRRLHFKLKCHGPEGCPASPAFLGSFIRSSGCKAGVLSWLAGRLAGPLAGPLAKARLDPPAPLALRRRAIAIRSLRPFWTCSRQSASSRLVLPKSPKPPACPWRSFATNFPPLWQFWRLTLNRSTAPC